MELDELERNIMDRLMKEEKPISSDRLADLCNASRVTIRTKIPVLNEKIHAFGLCIQPIRSSGFILEVTDEQLAMKLIPSLRFRINRSAYNLSSHSDRVDFILRALLSTSGCVPVQTLCDALFISYSALHRELHDVEQELALFDLALVTKRSKGLTIEGSEWKRRLCMLYQHKRFVRLDSEKQMQEKPFGDIFYSFSEEHLHARRIVTETLKSFPTYIYSFLDIPKLTNYLFLLAFRRESGHPVQFRDEQYTQIRNTPSHNLAKEILKNTGYLFTMPVSEEETLGYAILLECARSLTSFDQIEPERRKRTAEELDALLLNFRSIYDFDLSCIDENTLSLLRCTHAMMRTQTFFDYVPDLEHIYPQMHSSYSIAYDALIHLHHFWADTYHEELPEPIRMMALFTARLLLQTQDHEKGDLRIGIISTYGINYARIIANALQQYYCEEIQTITALEYSNMEAAKQCDVILTDIDKVQDQLTPIPCLWMNLSSGKTRLGSLDRFIQQRNEEERRKLCTQPVTWINAKNREELLLILSQDLSSHCCNPQLLMEEMFERTQNRSCLHQNMLFLSRSTSDCPNTVRVYVNRTPIRIQDRSIQVIVFYAYDYRNQRLRKTIGRTFSLLCSLTQNDYFEAASQRQPLSDLLKQHADVQKSS